MTIYIDNHDFHYETENLVRMFFPNEKLDIVHEKPVNPQQPFVVTSMMMENGKTFVSAEVGINGCVKKGNAEVIKEDEPFEKTAERTLAVCLYGILSSVTGVKQPWGILTGVRPIKLFRRISADKGEEYAKKYFENRLLVSHEKTELSALTEKHERKILELSKPMSYSLYISIPFCPTRCSYCSFVSQTVEKAKKLIEPYFELLCRELVFTADIAREKNLILESVYIGGGTPTTLSAEQLSVLIDVVRKNFDLSVCREFTIEAGRPDTIDEKKLYAIYNGGVDRISINPQTLNDNVLNVIGRKHNSQQILDAFALARRIGFQHINMDLIAGLPTETTDSFVSTLDKICTLDPESITVHTLALKRSSKLTLEGAGVRTEGETTAAKMLRYCEKKLTGCGYIPYYLYRQSRMEGNLENVGWSKKGKEGIYNVFVMDETHTIIGCGAGAVTKLKTPGTESLVRIFNYKYPYEYINGFEEMLKRKEQVRAFYDELS